VRNTPKGVKNNKNRCHAPHLIALLIFTLCLFQVPDTGAGVQNFNLAGSVLFFNKTTTNRSHAPHLIALLIFTLCPLQVPDTGAGVHYSGLAGSVLFFIKQQRVVAMPLI